MKSGAGKQKGSAFERAICQRLSLWVTDGKKKDCFWRSAMSGGRATVAGKKGVKLSRQAGDICSVSPEGHQLTEQFYVECKSYTNLRILKFLLKCEGPLAKFWKTARREARKYHRQPMLIVKQNRLPVLVLTRRLQPRALLYHNGLGCEIGLLSDLEKTPWSDLVR